MKKNRQTKIMVIVALCVAVLCLTLGFAAFSNTLTISSSATVTPESSDFKIAVYGIPSLGEYNQYEAGNNNDGYREKIVLPDSKFTSITTTTPVLFRQYEGEDIAITAAKKAVITSSGSSVSIKDLSINFSEPGQGAEYYFLLKNEGNYDGYINIANPPTPTKTCEAGEGATPSLVENACKSISLTPQLAMEENGEYVIDDLSNYVDERGNLKIAIGQKMLFSVLIHYGTSGERSDGPFLVKWSDITYTFTTNAQ